MGLGTSILLIAVGAIMKFALHVQSDSLDVNTVGTILLIVGICGALLSLAFWSSWGGSGINRSRRTTVSESGGSPIGYDGSVPAPRVVHEEIRDDRF